MSTKIHTGFIFTTTDLLEIHKEIMAFRHELGAKVEEKLIQYFARECSILLDAASVGARKLKKTDSVYGIVYQKYLEKTDEVRQMKRHPEVDFSFNLSILPTEDGRILGIIFTEQQEFFNLWVNKPFVEDFSYQDQVGKPDEISEEDWKDREETWDKVLSQFVGIPNMLGYSADCVPTFIEGPQLDDVIKAFPSFEDRSDRIAEDVLFEEQNRKEKFDPKSAVKIYTNYMKWLKSDEGRLTKAKKQGVLEYKMIREVKREDLNGNV